MMSDAEADSRALSEGESSWGRSLTLECWRALGAASASGGNRDELITTVPAKMTRSPRWLRDAANYSAHSSASRSWARNLAGTAAVAPGRARPGLSGATMSGEHDDMRYTLADSGAITLAHCRLPWLFAPRAAAISAIIEPGVRGEFDAGFDRQHEARSKRAIDFDIFGHTTSIFQARLATSAAAE